MYSDINFCCECRVAANGSYVEFMRKTEIQKVSAMEMMMMMTMELSFLV